MFDLDDPLLALILRFVASNGQAPASNEAFLKQQVKSIRKYVAKFPAEEQSARAMEWVLQRAEKYRDDWQRRTVSSRTDYLRCEDCPLQNLGAAEHCEIHEQWRYLLSQFIAGKIDSANYVENNLEMLRRHKNELKLRNAGSERDVGRPDKPGKKKKKKKKHKPGKSKPVRKGRKEKQGRD